MSKPILPGEVEQGLSSRYIHINFCMVNDFLKINRNETNHILINGKE